MRLDMCWAGEGVMQERGYRLGTGLGNMVRVGHVTGYGAKDEPDDRHKLRRAKDGDGHKTARGVRYGI